MIDADAANLYAAIDHSADAEPHHALRLCNALSDWWWLHTARLVEGITALNRTLDATDDDRSALRGRALAWRGYLAFFTGDSDLARQDATEALAIAEELGDKMIGARALGVVGIVEFMPNPRTALPTLERSAELARAAGDDWCLAEAMQNVGLALLFVGERDAARSHVEASLELARHRGLRDLVTWCWSMLGHIVYPSGDREAARALWERGVDEAGDIQEWMATWGLGLFDVDAGKPAAAREHAEGAAWVQALTLLDLARSSACAATPTPPGHKPTKRSPSPSI